MTGRFNASLQVVNRLFARSRIATLIMTLAIVSSVYSEDADNDASATTETLPIRRVVLYNSGVAQMLHRGTVSPKQPHRLAFDASQIDDVLKSLVFDVTDGNAPLVRYQPAPTRTKIAANEFVTPLTIAQLLQKYRGESLTMTGSDLTVQGRIVGVESRVVDDNEREYITLLDDGKISSWLLSSIDSFRFDNDSIREQFSLAMTGLTESRTQEVRSLSLTFDGEQDREVKLAYVVDAPVWRLTWRVDVQPDRSTLQGWAHVDNVSGNDWQEVALELRSGDPHSFRADIFLPLIAQRPHADLSIFGGSASLRLMDDLLSGGLAGNGVISLRGGGGGWKESGKFFGGGGGGFGGRGSGGGGTFGGGGMPEDVDSLDELELSNLIRPGADLTKAHQTVRFEIDHPVDLPAGNSLMLPVLKTDAEVKFLTRFGGKQDHDSGELIARVKNDSKYPLLAGPAVIYREGAFVGDSRLTRTEIGDDLVMAFGLDRSVALDSDSRTLPLDVKSVVIDKSGEIAVKGTRTRVLKLTATNKDDADREILYELSQESGTELSPTPTRDDDDVAGYEFSVPAGKESSVEIRLTQAENDSKPLKNLGDQGIDALLELGDVVEAATRERIIEFKQVRADLLVARNRLMNLEAKVKSLKNQQSHWTSLIQPLEREPDQDARAKFVAKLLQAEDQIEKLQLQLTLPREKVAALERYYRELSGDN